MQSYLGTYTGSRSDSEFKFLRAVKSFINQTYKNSELVIVSDGCDVTHRLYFENFKHEKRIKYVFVDKDVPNMYDVESNTEYYRGFPRQLGVETSTGEIITYMDSDDFLLDYAAQVIVDSWKELKEKDENIKFILKNSWYVHESVNNGYLGKLFKKDSELIEIKGLPEKWLKTIPKDPYAVITSTWSVSHVKDISSKWVDVKKDDLNKMGEDNLFIKNLFDESRVFIESKNPHYAVCHSRNNWDC